MGEGMLDGIEGAIFDLDGTLLDSMDVWADVDRKFLGERGFAVPDDYMPTIASMQFREIADYTIERFGLDDTPEALMDEWTRLAAYAYGHEVEAKPGARRFLEALKARGIRLAVATTLLPGLREPALEHLGLLPLFDAIVDVDMAGAGKSRPDIYLLAASKLGVEPESCLVFEDILPAIRSARQAGMHPWGVLDASSRSDWGAIEREADGTLNDFTGLL